MPTPIKINIAVKIALIATLLFITGCSSITGERIAQDGSRLTIRAHRMLWKSDKIAFTLESQGLKATLSVGSSATDAETAKAITEGAVKALTRP